MAIACARATHREQSRGVGAFELEARIRPVHQEDCHRWGSDRQTACVALGRDHEVAFLEMYISQPPPLLRIGPWDDCTHDLSPGRARLKINAHTMSIRWGGGCEGAINEIHGWQ